MKVRHFINFILSGMLVILGFSACEYSECEEYGSPYVNYIFKGVVTSSDGTPIKGVKVLVKKNLNVETNYTELYTQIKTNTDSNGAYDSESKFSPNEKPYVVFQDVDGADNGGTYKNDSIMNSNLVIKKIKGSDGHWNTGTYLLTGNITLQKKVEE